MAQAAGHIESHAAMFTFTVADTATMNSYNQKAFLGGRGINGQIDVGGVIVSGVAPVDFGQQEPIDFSKDAAPVAISKPNTLDLSKDNAPVVFSTPKALDVSKDAVPIAFSTQKRLDLSKGDEPVAFSKPNKVVFDSLPPPVLGHVTAVNISDNVPVISEQVPLLKPDPPPKITLPLPVMVNEEPPDAYTHEIGGWYKALDTEVLNLVPPKDASPSQRAVFSALAQQAREDRSRAVAFKTHVLALGAHIHQQLARVVTNEQQGNDDTTDVLQVRLQQEVQQMDLQDERHVLLALRSVVAKYEALAALPDVAVPAQVKSAACARQKASSLPAAPKGGHAGDDWHNSYRSIQLMDFCWCKYNSVLERIGCQEKHTFHSKQ